jgi:hypothetical protein
MPSARFARIAITLPARDLAAADRLAKSHDRSRSWIIAEAVRRYAASAEAGEAPGPSRAVKGASEAVPAAAAPGLGASRLDQLRRDLALTPEERVRAAEETLRLTKLQHGPRPQQVLAFDRYEDYLDWKRRQDAHA